MTANKNTKVSPDTIKSLHWKEAKGFELKKGKRVFHPYTRNDFKFGVE